MHQAELNIPYNLIALPAECNGVAMEYTLFNWHFQHLLLIYYLLAETTFTFCPLGYNLALSLTIVACLLHLLVHPRTHLVHLNKYMHTCTTRPFPLQVPHVFTLSPPLPLQV
mgnify:CR=1 FL=1